MDTSSTRLAQLQKRMAAAEVDLVAVGPTTDMRYLLDMSPMADERLCLLLVDPTAARLVVPAVNAEGVAAATDLPLLRWADETGPAEALAAALAQVPPVRRLAVDGAMRADSLLTLQSSISPRQVISTAGLLAPLRLHKSADEIQGLARAAAQADRAMSVGIAACRPGVRESEVAWAIESAFRQDGAEHVDFAIVASGPNAAFPHHHPGARTLAADDGVILDIGATLAGYHSDITRVVHLGKPSAEFRAAYDTVLAANAAGRAAVRPGVSAGEVDAAVRSVIAAAGLGSYYIHRTGHGLGLDGHEPPWIADGDPTVLETGMVFSIEPGVYLRDRFGIRIEDIVAVTEDGCRLLTGYDHELVVAA